MLDDQIAVLALGREPLANLDEAPVEVRWLLLVEDVQGAKMARPTAGGGEGIVYRRAARGYWLSLMGNCPRQSLEPRIVSFSDT